MCSEAVLNKILSEVRKASEDTFGDKLVDVILYGSYARGDFDEESDIDIMVRVDMRREDYIKNHRTKIIHLASDLSLDYDITVSIQVQDNAEFERWRGVMPFFQNVIREGRQIGAE